MPLQSQDQWLQSQSEDWLRHCARDITTLRDTGEWPDGRPAWIEQVTPDFDGVRGIDSHTRYKIAQNRVISEVFRRYLGVV